MQEHAFDFGSAVSVEHITGDSEDDEIYRETFLENFNKAVVENGLKYPAFLGEWGDSKEGAKATLDWLNERDVPTRGHYLVWEEWSTEGGGGMGIEDPDSLTDAEVQQQMLDRITDHATDIGDSVTEWDMHNHPIWQPNIRDRLGWDAVLEWWEAGDEATDAGCTPTRWATSRATSSASNITTSSSACWKTAHPSTASASWATSSSPTGT